MVFVVGELFGSVASGSWKANAVSPKNILSPWGQEFQPWGAMFHWNWGDASILYQVKPSPSCWNLKTCPANPVSCGPAPWATSTSSLWWLDADAVLLVAADAVVSRDAVAMIVSATCVTFWISWASCCCTSCGETSDALAFWRGFGWANCCCCCTSCHV